MSTSSSSSANNKKFLWFCQSNPNHSDKKGQKQWKRYSDCENDIIEKPYKKTKTEAHFNDNVINFQLRKHYKKNDINTQRPVKREEVDLIQYAREERFCSSEEVVSTSLERIDNEKNFINQWKNKIGQDVYTKYSVVAELAAQGIIEEGRLQDKESNAQTMAKELCSCESKEEIWACAARLYTADSFLFRLVNKTLRNHDMSKVDTLGPFCHLLSVHLLFNHYNSRNGNGLLYRGMKLTDEMIKEYGKAVHDRYYIFWPAFTSTTKDYQVAAMYGANTICIISIPQLTGQSDLSHLSHFPDEQEVLICSQGCFSVDKIGYDATNAKHLLYMTRQRGMRYSEKK